MKYIIALLFGGVAQASQPSIVNDALLHNIAIIESNLNEHAVGKNGEAGAFQLKHSAWVDGIAYLRTHGYPISTKAITGSVRLTLIPAPWLLWVCSSGTSRVSSQPRSSRLLCVFTWPITWASRALCSMISIRAMSDLVINAGLSCAGLITSFANNNHDERQ